jgi:hypothetical protein
MNQKRFFSPGQPLVFPFYLLCTAMVQTPAHMPIATRREDSKYLFKFYVEIFIIAIFFFTEICFYHLAINPTRPNSFLVVGGYTVLHASTLNAWTIFVLCESPSSSPKVVVNSYTVVISIVDAFKMLLNAIFRSWASAVRCRTRERGQDIETMTRYTNAVEYCF